jgi:dTDP-4-amino-4,6-dideoxygalactose transaminase
MIPVTKTFLPPIDVYREILQQAWDKRWITNRGELVKRLEHQLREYLEVPYITLTCNGTVPLQVAIRALGIKGKVITTPFSYVATTSVISWEHCEPVFADIEPGYYTIDPSEIEKRITPGTTAILATHVFGNPCDTEAIERIAEKHGLKVIYDGAHAFGVNYRGVSLFRYGDVSTCSFHATKLFHTAEGGCMITNNASLQDTLFYHHNFGHKGPEAFQGIGINGKMSELSAAMGLAVLPYVQNLIAERKKRINHYLEKLNGLPLEFIHIREQTEWNFSYFPVVFDSEETLLRVRDALHARDIYPRRYFYPSLTTLGYVNKYPTPVGDHLAKCVLCLPLYDDLGFEDIERTCDITSGILR